MGRIAVKEKKEMEILGLTIDARGNWSRHVQAIASDARKRLGAIRRMSHMLDDKIIMRASLTKLLCAQRLSMAAWPTGELQKAI